MSELVPRSELAKTDNGRYRIPDTALREISTESLFEFVDAFSTLVLDNPEYEFEIFRNPVDNYLTVSWRKLL